MIANNKTNQELTSNNFWHGNLNYNIQNLSSCFSFIKDCHLFTQNLIRKFNSNETIDIFIYGAALPGRILSMIMSEYKEINFKGFIDIRDDICSTLIPEINILRHANYKIYNPRFISSLKMDALICSTSSDHYNTIINLLKEQMFTKPCFFLYRHTSIRPIIEHHENRKPFIIATTGRCGTHWLKGMINLISTKYGYDEIQAYGIKNNNRYVKNDIFKQLKENQFALDHFRPSDNLFNAAKEGKIKLAFLYRDPRDIHVSSEYYNYKKFVFNLDFIKNKAKYIKTWLDKDFIHCIKFEDLVSDTKNTLSKLVYFLDIPYDDELIELVISIYTFSYLSGGRKPGQHDPSSHYRKGIIGDWKNHFSPENIKQVESECGRHLAAIGYKL